MVVKHTNSRGTGGGELAADGKAYIGHVYGDKNDDAFVVDKNSTITGVLFPDLGNDSVLLDSGGRIDLYVSSVSLSHQSSTFEVYNNTPGGVAAQQTVIGELLNGGNGKDTIIIDGSGYKGSEKHAISIGEKGDGGAIYGKGGDDTISIKNSVLIAGNIDHGHGSDTVSIGPDVLVKGSVYGGGDNLDDMITITDGATIEGSVYTTSGNDIITIDGQVGDGKRSNQINSGEGRDVITLTSNADVDISRIAGVETLDIKVGAETKLYVGGFSGAGIVGTHGDDTLFLGGTYDSSHDIDVDAFYSSSDTVTLGKDFSAINKGANSVFKIMGGGNDLTHETDTLDLSAIAGRIVSHELMPMDAERATAEHGVVTLNDGSVIEYFEFENVIICFAGGTKVKTINGARVVEELCKGDLVYTRDNGFQPIRWIGSRKLCSAELEASPNLYPIRIRAGALGKNTPESDLMVSPQHRILVRSQIAQRMFDTGEVLVGAKHLLEIDGIEIAEDITEVEYFHILFDRHEVIFSNGAETESLHTGPEAIKSLSPSARKEIFTLFPELQKQDPALLRPAARPLVSGRMGRQLAMRHLKNKRELVC